MSDQGTGAHRVGHLAALSPTGREGQRVPLPIVSRKEKKMCPTVCSEMCPAVTLRRARFPQVADALDQAIIA